MPAARGIGGVEIDCWRDSDEGLGGCVVVPVSACVGACKSRTGGRCRRVWSVGDRGHDACLVEIGRELGPVLRPVLGNVFYPLLAKR